jgi:DNA repair exonuclease SbcCD ATPase subunit
MIEFKTIRYKNLLSSGNVFTEVPLNSHTTTLIVGENGAGKSTILDALTFGLYGRPFRKINKGQLVNSINKRDMLVEIEFTVGHRDYMVRRGIKPNVFEVFQDGQLMNISASTADYQDILDKQVLKLNYKSFSQIVVLGSASFVPFMQLTAAARREVIEDLLDIQVFSVMNTLLKDRAHANKTAITEAQHRVKVAATLKASYKEHAKSIQDDRDAQILAKKQQLASIKTEVIALKETIAERTAALAPYANLEEQQRSFTVDRQGLEHRLSMLEERIRGLQEHTTFFHDHDNCPSCQQKIDDNHRHDIVRKIDTDINAHRERIEQIKSQIADINTTLAALAARNAEAYNITQSLSESRSELRTRMSIAQSINEDIKQLKARTSIADDYSGKIVELDATMATEDAALDKLTTDRAVIEAASVLLKDTGIKTRIIKQYMPVINKLINKYLAAMDFFVNFEIDENFNESIKSRFRDEFSYASFSEGEKSRLDLALLFTWRSIARLRNSASTNLLILDEVFDGSLDAQGNDELLKIINELSEGSNVFVISHKTDAYTDKFERVLRFEKVKNFSRMKTA